MSHNPTRLAAIDQFRGFAILTMVLADFLNPIETLPGWLKHADDVGFTAADLVAPFFVFAIGLTFGLSFQRRLARSSAWDTYQHFITRNLALLGLGLLITLGGVLAGLYPASANWGLLQALGAAGLIALAVIRLPSRWRWFIGLTLLAGYQLLLDRYWLDIVRQAVHNGPQGALSWGAMLILATALADLYFDASRGRRWFPWASLALALAGLGISLWAPLSKDRATASYVLLSLGLSGLVFWIFHLLDKGRRFEFRILSAWGQNPLLLYLLHGLVLGIFALPPFPSWYHQAPPGLALVQATALVAFMSWVGLALQRRGLFFSL